MYDTDSLIDRIRELENQVGEKSDDPITIPLEEWDGPEDEIGYLQEIISRYEDVNSCLPVYARYEKCPWSHEMYELNQKLMEVMRQRIVVLKQRME